MRTIYIAVKTSVPNQFISQLYRNVLEQQFCESMFEHCYIYRKLWLLYLNHLALGT